MEFLTDIWGVNNNIGIPEVAARAFVMFFFLLLLVRIFGMRPFGKTEPFDILIAILLGAVAARGIVGASPFFSTLAASFALVLIHRILAKLSFYNKSIGRHLKGSPTLLYQNGSFLNGNMRSANITEHDIFEELRYTLHMNSLDEIAEIYFERNGRISFILRKKS